MKMNPNEPAKITATTPRNEASLKKAFAAASHLTKKYEKIEQINQPRHQ